MADVKASSSVFTELSVAIADIKQKKSKLDAANETASIAAREWNDAVENAKSLRIQLNTELDATVPLEIKPKIR